MVECIKTLLESAEGEFPPPAKIADFLEWDDWKVLGLISEGRAGDHGDILRFRNHYRMVYSTAEIAKDDEISMVEELAASLETHGCVVRDAEKSWYKSGSEEIKVWRTSDRFERSVPLQTLSPVVAGLIKVNQRRLYVPECNRQAAEAALRYRTEK